MENITHHPSNAKNCSKCMDLWIARENKKNGSKKITEAQKEILKPEWDKMEEFCNEMDKKLDVGKLVLKGLNNIK